MARCGPISSYPAKDEYDSEDTWWPILTGDEAASKVPYALFPGEKVTMCPFDHSHWFRLSKSQHHLYKCRKNYIKSCKDKGINYELQKVECRFNPVHVLDAPEKMYHEFQCSYQTKGEEEQLEAVARYAPELKQDPDFFISSEEEWHIDPTVESYDPRAKLKSEAFIIPHCNSIMNKTEKAAFQASQRWHFFTRASGQKWKDLGSDEPEILKKPIVLPEDKDPSASEILDRLRRNQSDLLNVSPPTPRPGRRFASLYDLDTKSEEAADPLTDDLCVQFVNSFATPIE